MWNFPEFLACCWSQNSDIKSAKPDKSQYFGKSDAVYY